MFVNKGSKTFQHIYSRPQHIFIAYRLALYFVKTTTRKQQERYLFGPHNLLVAVNANIHKT